MNKLLAITGPTATGKTSLAISLAKKFNGEIISADSRQVYKGMDIGTGKDRQEYEKARVKVWGLDLVDPDYNFNVSDYLDYARAKARSIWEANRLPIVVGGTVLYIKSLLNPPETVHFPPNERLRHGLSSYSVDKLQQELKRQDKNRWENMNPSDRNNPRRLIRAIEIANTRNISNFTRSPKNEDMGHSIVDVLIVSLSAPLTEIYKRIDERVDKRVEQGILQEIQSLLKKGYSWDLPSLSASGYKEFQGYFLAPSPQQLATRVSRWKFHEHAYARHQMTFLRKLFEEVTKEGITARWVDITQQGYEKSVTDVVEQWYTNSDGRRQET